MLSFHRCVSKTQDGTEDTFLNNLELRQQQKVLLRQARTLTRNALRVAFRRETSVLLDGDLISPNFFTQGSWGYRTINRPTHVPPQQADMDDGCYLPITFARGASPKRAATWFYGVADNALRALVKEQSWAAYDDTKDRCCRVIIDKENHVDVPLYAIRDEMFMEMKRSLTEDRAAALAEALSYAAEDEHDFDWSEVTQEDVLIARRNGAWDPSNPMEVKRWVLSAADQASDQLVTTWRGMKGWRDHNFASGGPSSIVLMVMIEEDFDEIKGRADLALRAGAISVRKRVMEEIYAPWDPRENLNRLSREQRTKVAAKANELEEEINYCVQGSVVNAPIYLKRLRDCLGRHFSEDSSRVVEVSANEVIHSYSAVPAAFPPFKGDNRSA